MVLRVAAEISRGVGRTSAQLNIRLAGKLRRGTMAVDEIGMRWHYGHCSGDRFPYSWQDGYGAIQGA